MCANICEGITVVADIQIFLQCVIKLMYLSHGNLQVLHAC